MAPPWEKPPRKILEDGTRLRSSSIAACTFFMLSSRPWGSSGSRESTGIARMSNHDVDEEPALHVTGWVGAKGIS
jgi:hypothetical protein